MWSDGPFFPSQTKGKAEGMIWGVWVVVGNAGVNKAVLDLALAVRVPATLLSTYLFLLERPKAKWRSMWAHPLSVQALILPHVSLPHVSRNEGVGLRIHWKMGCQDGGITLLWFPPHRHFKALLVSKHIFPPSSFSCSVLQLYCTLLRWKEPFTSFALYFNREIIH